MADPPTASFDALPQGDAGPVVHSSAGGRPPSLLSEADLKEIARNLRKYSEKYAKEDDVLMAQVQRLFPPWGFSSIFCECAPGRIAGRQTADRVASMQQDVCRRHLSGTRK